jgi:hypothetical protein
VPLATWLLTEQELEALRLASSTILLAMKETMPETEAQYVALQGAIRKIGRPFASRIKEERAGAFGLPVLFCVCVLYAYAMCATVSHSARSPQAGMIRPFRPGAFWGMVGANSGISTQGCPMKRDMDLVRDILLRIEEHDVDSEDHHIKWILKALRSKWLCTI